jgi:septal ring factor EnvC (AmiA/AmiB activator)
MSFQWWGCAGQCRRVILVAWQLYFSKEDLGEELRRMNDFIERWEPIVASWAEVKQGTIDYINELKAQRDEAVGALTDAQSSAQANADALAAFQADDAATDAQQIAEAQQALANELAAAVESVKNPPAEPEPLPEEPPVEEPPA